MKIGKLCTCLLYCSSKVPNLLEEAVVYNPILEAQRSFIYEFNDDCLELIFEDFPDRRQKLALDAACKHFRRLIFLNHRGSLDIQFYPLFKDMSLVTFEMGIFSMLQIKFL